MLWIKGEWATRKVWVRGLGEPWRKLLPYKSQAVYNHSPDGFCWGYGGSGPAQLALALLLEFTDENTALEYYQEFKRNVIAMLPQADFLIKWDHKAIMEQLNDFRRTL